MQVLWKTIRVVLTFLSVFKNKKQSFNGTQSKPALILVLTTFVDTRYFESNRIFLSNIETWDKTIDFVVFLSSYSGWFFFLWVALKLNPSWVWFCYKQNTEKSLLLNFCCCDEWRVCLCNITAVTVTNIVTVVTGCHGLSPVVTETNAGVTCCHRLSWVVTGCHGLSPVVTKSLQMWLQSPIITG